MHERANGDSKPTQSMKHVRDSLTAAILSGVICLQAATAQTTTPVPDPAPINPELPTIFIAGDSTAARNNGNPTQGWGVPFADYFDPALVNIANRARGGRSSRTFITEGLWEQLLTELKAGDFVLIQFGHNDGGAINAEPPGSTRPLRARGSLPGIGGESEEIDNVVTGKHEVVRTFGSYLRTMIADVRARDATPIVLSTTVRNIWEDDRVERGPGEYREWSKAVAVEAGVPFIDVARIVADEYQTLGQAQVAELFGTDHTHTTVAGADLNASAVVAGLKGFRDLSFATLVSEKGSGVERDFIGWLNLSEPADQTLPTLMIVGDSTARNGRGDGSEHDLWGWGEPFVDLFDPAKVNVVNRAVGGTSSRTFITSGYWERALTLLKPGDVLLIQFGHNDASPVNDDRRARGTLAGLGDETETIENILTGKHEVVHTYGWYLRAMIEEAQARGVSPVLVTPTLTNSWRDGHIGPGPGGGNYAVWTRELAEEAGLPLVDLARDATPIYEQLGEDGMGALFPFDHTHTGAEGAALNARLISERLQALPKLSVGAWVKR
jgi:lysophospholipase L1-like esterase